MKRKRTKTVDGYRIQPMLPIHIGTFGAICEQADFTTYGDTGPCVEALVRIGLIEAPYTLVLSYEQALEADIIEKTGVALVPGAAFGRCGEGWLRLSFAGARGPKLEAALDALEGYFVGS